MFRKITISAFFITVFCKSNVICNVLTYVPGVPAHEVSLEKLGNGSIPTVVSYNANEYFSCDNYFSPICSDCHTLATCAGEIINMQNCAEIDPLKPYCSENACTADYSAKCNLPFRCTRQGVFPNPNDCTSYYFCASRSTNGAIIYRCPTNYVFDSKKGMCKQKVRETDCVKISCAGNYNKYQILPTDKSILIYCADTKILNETIMFRCEDFENMEYSAATLQCTFVCKKEGRFPDKLDSRKFYECYKSGAAFLFKHEICPEEFTFNVTSNMCDWQGSREQGFNIRLLN